MSKKNTPEEKARRRALRDLRKGMFQPSPVSYPIMNKATKIEFDEEGNQTESEVEVPSGTFRHLPTRKDRRSK